MKKKKERDKERAEGEWHKSRKEQGHYVVGWVVMRNGEDMEDQPEGRGVRCVDEWRCGARRARSRKNEEDKETKEYDRRCQARKMRRR